MSEHRRLLALLTLMASGAASVHAAAAGDAPPSYTNVQVVSVDAVGRTLVVRKPSGMDEKLALDDTLAGFGDIKAGDHVIVSFRSGPGWTRVSSIAKSTAVPPPRVTASPVPSPRPAAADNARVVARDAFDVQVARVGGQADRVDRVWNDFKSACSFKGTPREGARGWFAVWEGSIRADMSGGVCRDLFNQVVDLGEPVKQEMNAAEDVARRTLTPGEIRDIRRLYRMDWDGWALTAPKPLER